jgi:hypothetical protein
MKKKNLALLMLLTLFVSAIYAQADSLANQMLIEDGAKLSAGLLARLIPGLPNEIVVFLITTLVGVIHRQITIRKWKKKGLLNKLNAVADEVKSK